MLSPANFLILDEPTNHLDIPSKEILEDAIESYEGTVLYVSHDRYFINKTATRILELRNGVLTNYKGNYNYYEENKDRLYELQHGSLSNGDAGNAGKNDGQKSEGRIEYEKKKSAYAEQRKQEKELKRLNKSIEKIETELDEINAALNDPANGTNVSKLVELSERKEALEEELLELYEKLEEAGE
jgi:ATP-binding cassette subfamily F protein 3